MPSCKNILVIRSATRILNQTLNALKQEFPDCRITVLAPKGVEDAMRQDPLVDEVLTIGAHRRMGVLNYGWKNIAALQKCRFDLAVSLYNVDHGLGYSNIDTLAWASKAKEIRGYNPRGTYVDLSGRGVLKKWFFEKTTLLWVALNFIATAVLFSCITLALVGEWCFRKLFASKERFAPELKRKPCGTTTSPPEVSDALTRV